MHYIKTIIQNTFLIIIAGCLPLSAAQAITLLVPSEYSTIQQAITASVNGDTVLVAPGSYAGPIIYGGKLIAVISSDGPSATTITANNSTNIVLFTDNETSEAVLEGFRLQGGWGAILCENAGPTIRRNILVGQHITNWGAISLGGNGYATTGASPAVIVNNTIVNCTNGAISTFSTIAPIIKNNILAFNGHYGIHRSGSSQPHPNLSYNNVFGNSVAFQNIFAGLGAIAADPRFNSSFALTLGSPCINTGDPDPFFNDPDGSRNDMGALPFSGALPGGPGIRRVPSEFSTIQSAILAAIQGDTILVAAGTYIETIDFMGKSLKLLSESGAEATTILASSSLSTFTVTGNIDSTSQGDGEASDTTGSGGAIEGVITMTGGSDATTEIVGFTISGQNQTRCIYGVGVSPTVRDCIIEHGFIFRDGGGIFFEDGAPTIINNIFRNNVTDISGGGLFVRLGIGFGTVWIEGNTFFGNIGGNGPAISLIEGDDAVIVRNIAYNNTATSGSQRRGAIYVRGANLSILSNTCNGNTVGITVLMSDGVDIRNNILTNNDEFGLKYLNNESPINTNIVNDCNDIWGNTAGDYFMATAGANDISLNPQFCNTALNDYHIAATSPCAAANNNCGELIGALNVGCEDGVLLCVDVNGDSQVTQDDLDFLIAFYFSNGPAPDQIDMGDLNCSGGVDIADIVLMAMFLQGDGPDLCCLDGEPGEPKSDWKKKPTKLETSDE